jgi:hypothetical protein
MKFSSTHWRYIDIAKSMKSMNPRCVLQWENIHARFCENSWSVSKVRGWTYTRTAWYHRHVGKSNVIFRRFLKNKSNMNQPTLTHSFMELSPSREAANCAGTQKLPSILSNRRFITVFTRALHWSLSWARSIQSILSHLISLRSILILSTTYVLVSSMVSFLQVFPPIFYMHSFPHSCYMLCPSHPPWPPILNCS